MVAPCGGLGGRGPIPGCDGGTRPFGKMGKDASFIVIVPRGRVAVEEEHNINNTVITKKYPRILRETSDTIFSFAELCIRNFIYFDRR